MTQLTMENMNEKRQTRRRWTASEKASLLELFHLPNETLAERFNRTSHAICIQKSKIRNATKKRIKKENKKIQEPKQVEGSKHIVLLKETLDELKNEVEQSNKIISKKNNQLDTVNKTQKQLSIEVNTSRSKITELKGQTDAQSQMINQLQRIINEKDKKISKIERLKNRNFFQRLFNIS